VILAVTATIGFAAAAHAAPDHAACEALIQKAMAEMSAKRVQFRDKIPADVTPRMVLADDFAVFETAYAENVSSRTAFNWMPCIGDDYAETLLALTPAERAIFEKWQRAQRARKKSAPTPTPARFTAACDPNEEPDHAKLSRCQWAKYGYYSWQDAYDGCVQQAGGGMRGDGGELGRQMTATICRDMANDWSQKMGEPKPE
jgi:hypothetical protein